MSDEIFIDERGRFQMPREDLTPFLKFLRENKVACSAEEADSFTSEGHSHGFGRIHHLYDEATARNLHRTWKSYQEGCQAAQPLGS
jgi:hypothetical protein